MYKNRLIIKSISKLFTTCKKITTKKKASMLKSQKDYINIKYICKNKNLYIKIIKRIN